MNARASGHQGTSTLKAVCSRFWVRPPSTRNVAAARMSIAPKYTQPAMVPAEGPKVSLTYS